MQLKTGKPEDKQIIVDAKIRSPENRRTLKLNCKKSFDMFSPTSAHSYEVKPFKRFQRSSQGKIELRQKNAECQGAKVPRAQAEASSRKISIPNRTTNPFKKQKQYELARNLSQQALNFEPSKQSKLPNSNAAPFRFKFASVGTNTNQRSQRIISAKVTAEDKLVRRMISQGLDTGVQPSLGTPKITRNQTRTNTSDQEYQVSKLKVENEFMRSLYHRLIIAKQKDRLKHAETEAKLKRDRRVLKQQVEKLKNQLSQIKQSKKIRIDHLFTHKGFDKVKNGVRRENQIKQVPFQMEQSSVAQPIKQNFVMDSSKEYYSGTMILLPHADNNKGFCISINSNCEYGTQAQKITKVPLERKKTREDQLQLSLISASDSFYSLGLQSGNSTMTIDE